MIYGLSIAAIVLALWWVCVPPRPHVCRWAVTQCRHVEGVYLAYAQCRGCGEHGSIARLYYQTSWHWFDQGLLDIERCPADLSHEAHQAIARMELRERLDSQRKTR